MSEWTFAVVAGAFLLIVGSAIESSSCHSQWDGAQLGKVTYGPIQGCMIEYADGRKMPAGAHREVLK